MDTQNELTMASSQMEKEISQHKVIVGTKQLKKALAAGRAHRVSLAQNADSAITDLLADLCRHHSVEYAWVKSMADLGRACGIEVGAAAAASVD